MASGRDYPDFIWEQLLEPEDKGEFFVNGLPSDHFAWKDILRFNWDCIIDTAGQALRLGLDVVIDYVIEKELSRVRELAAACGADLCYIVLTADAEALEQRIRSRGDIEMIERALFLKRELEAMPENQGHIYNNTGKTIEDMLREIDPEEYLVSCDKTGPSAFDAS